MIATAAAAFGWTSAAVAGGSWLDTTKSSYEPGDRVVAVGYVEDGTADGPFFANLGLTPIPDLPPSYSQTWLALGEVLIEDSGLGGYLANRVSFEFDIPLDLPAGEYEVAVRNADDEFFGDLIGLTLYVGFDPGYERWIEWPLDEPLIADLAPDDVIAGPGWSLTVADLRDGQYPPGAAEFMLQPELLPTPTTAAGPIETPVTTVAPVSTTTVVPASTTTVPTSTTSTPDSADQDEQPATIASQPGPVGEEGRGPGGEVIAVLVGLIAAAALVGRSFLARRSSE